MLWLSFGWVHSRFSPVAPSSRFDGQEVLGRKSKLIDCKADFIFASAQVFPLEASSVRMERRNLQSVRWIFRWGKRSFV